ncbi:AbfB domain-containing protein [Actinoplanes sp. NEAU-A11]|uniref:AbfB domain-containing protein n=2 Tax=Actinoplanes aureus TaxID=2792083 RepID=A0A931C752_9ACTN|nr:AbfB domain-containing protein [Actinoplanes aureus]
MPQGENHEHPRIAGARRTPCIPALALAAATTLAVVSYAATAVVISDSGPRQGLGPVPVPPQGWTTRPPSVPVSVLPAPSPSPSRAEKPAPAFSYRKVSERTVRSRPPTTAPPPPPPLPVGRTLGLSPLDRPDHRVRHRNFVARVDPVTAASSPVDRADSRFAVRAGRADPRCRSFESVNQPGFYLRHRDFLLRLDRADQTTLFDQDATFCPVTGGGGFALRSTNYPTRHLLVVDAQVRLEEPAAGQPTVFRAVSAL